MKKYAADSVLAVAVIGTCFDSACKQNKKEEEKTMTLLILVVVKVLQRFAVLAVAKKCIVLAVARDCLASCCKDLLAPVKIRE